MNYNLHITIVKRNFSITKHTPIARFMGPTWGPPGSCRPHKPCYQGTLNIHRLMQLHNHCVDDNMSKVLFNMQWDRHCSIWNKKGAVHFISYYITVLATHMVTILLMYGWKVIRCLWSDTCFLLLQRQLLHNTLFCMTDQLAITLIFSLIHSRPQKRYNFIMVTLSNTTQHLHIGLHFIEI